MSTVKISQLPEITHLNTNTDDTLIVGVDTVTGETGKITVTTLAEGLYSNNALKVGLNQVQGANVIAQFTGNSSIFLQTVIQNFDANGSSDVVASTSDSDDTSRFVDMGINGADFSDSDYSSMKPYDAYLFNIGYQADSQTGNLVIGTGSTEADIVLIAGGTESANIVGRINKHSYAFYKDLDVTGNTSVTGYYEFADASVQSVAAAPANYTQSAFDAANTAAANTVVIQGINVTQNASITLAAANTIYLQGGLNTANANTVYLQAALNTANANSVLNATTAQNAYNKANNALANTSGTFQGNLNINGYISLNTAGGIYQETASPSVMVANTTGSFAIVTKRGSTPYTWSFGENGTLTTPGNVNVSGNTNMSSYVSIVKSNADANTPVVQITSHESGSYYAPANTHYLLQLTGKSNTATRFVMDSFGANSYPVIVGRMARGTIESPLAVANNDVLMRIVGNGYTGTQFTSSSPAKIDFIASENYTDSSKGSIIQFWNTPTGSNVIQKIASFNANSVEFSGSVIPEKGFVYIPRVLSVAQTAITIDFSTDSIVKTPLTNDLTVSFTNYTAGKIVEVWLTNTSGSGRTVTHGCSATNSSDNSTTFNIPATSSAYLRYFSLDGDLANTFVTSVHA